MAEWQIKTPGGHMISRIDPLIEHFGTCLREPDAVAGLVDDEQTIYVSHLSRWPFYADRIAGHGDRGHFIFHERIQSLDLYKSEQALMDALADLGPATSDWLTPQDGWKLTWESTMVMAEISAQWVDAFMDHLGNQGRRELSAERGVRVSELPDEILRELSTRYGPAFDIDTITMLELMSGNAPKSLTDQAVALSIDRLKEAGESVPLFIGFLVDRYGGAAAGSDDEPSGREATVRRDFELGLCARVLREHLEPASVPVEMLNPLGLAEQRSSAPESGAEARTDQ